MAQGNKITTFFSSGQGILLVGARDSTTGNPFGFRNMGDCSELTISVEQTTVDHRESSTGNRSIVKRITQETELNFVATLHDFSRENLEIAMYANSSTVAAGTATTEILRDGFGAELGRTNRLLHINVSAVVVTGPAGTPTYVEGDNYEVNSEGGSIFIYTDAEQTNRSAANNITEGDAIEIDYTFTSYEQVQALTQARQELWFRFEGLNTADFNSAVTVDIFKVDTDPLQDFSIIVEEFGEVALEGFALADATRATGSQFFETNFVRSFVNPL